MHMQDGNLMARTTTSMAKLYASLTGDLAYKDDEYC